MEKRKSERAKTNDEVLFSVDETAMRGRMLNLSRDGCMISGGGAHPATGNAVTVTLLEGVAVSGEIAWVDGDEIGVRFHRKLGEATVKYFLLNTIKYTHDEGPSDRFGRGLPPMRPDPGLTD
ncbi:PilZ domain-containing protein [Qipengyuania qiaonensis]|uniref:PilZ domain-containing protein n=1 Tax=Qipengyuania qiaonensis TaxID=2867240 RepID=A0ABS7J752_9SPHN|nr:PilZ domain-containing protein [Qipengyuania qiaonensis]MBX7481924.1 PilZ domain-containing protein [Qipengyuania qiaonensis]